MEWLWSWLAFSLAAGAFYQAYETKKDNKRLEQRISDLEDKMK